MDVMQLRRNLLKQQTSRIPSAYQEVEWVKGASAIIDLSYVVTVRPVVISKFAVNSSGDYDIMGFNANRSPSFILDCAKTVNQNTTWYNRFYTTSSYSFVYNIIFDEAYTFEIAVETPMGIGIKVNGSVVKDTLNTELWSNNTRSFNIMGGRNNHAGVTFYNFTLYDGTTKVRELVPCYRKSDNVIGFYDMVSEAFFTSSVGTLTKGNNV